MDADTRYLLLGGALAGVIWLALVAILGGIGSRRHPLPPIEQSCTSPALVVTLVHGTFGWFAPWLKPNSKLRREIAERFASQVIFQRCDWAGWNTFRSRRRAAERLNEMLVASLKKWPTACHFVIAHSHGGTASFEALNSRKGRDVSGLICIATPFLVVTRYGVTRLSAPVAARRRTVAGSTFLLIVWVSLQVWFPGTWVQIQELLFPPTNPKDGVLLFLAQLVLGMGLLIGLGYAVSSLASRLLVLLRDRAVRRLEDSFPPPKLTADELLILRQPGDEPSAFIGAAHAMAWLISLPTSLLLGAVQFFDRAVRRVKRLKRWGFQGIVIAVGGTATVSAGLLMWAVVGPFDAGVNAIGSLIIASWLMAMTAALLLTVVFEAALWLIGVFRFVMFLPAALSVGPEMLLAGSAWRVTAEATPAGMWSLTTIPVAGQTATSAGTFGNLWHSYVYESDVGVRTISEWMLKRCNDKALASSQSTEPLPTNCEPTSTANDIGSAAG